MDVNLISLEALGHSTHYLSIENEGEKYVGEEEERTIGAWKLKAITIREEFSNVANKKHLKMKNEMVVAAKVINGRKRGKKKTKQTP